MKTTVPMPPKTATMAFGGAFLVFWYGNRLLSEYMLLAGFNTGIHVSFDTALVVVLVLNLLLFFTLTFAPNLHNSLTDWFENTFLNRSKTNKG